MGDAVTTQKENLIDKKAWDGRFVSQQEAAYVPLTANPSQACANCRWFSSAYDKCFIVEDFPQPILATGWSNRWEATPVPTPLNQDPIPVVIVEPLVTTDDSAEMALPTTRRGLKELIVDLFKAQPKEKANPEQAFTAWKGLDNNYYWLARHTGKFVDREGEIIADHSHDEFVTRVQKGLVPMPELWTWHKKGTAHGQADFVWKAGGFTLALGHFTGTKEQQDRAVAYYQKMGDKIKLSHMFKYPKRGKRGKVYHAYNTVEITTLPDGAEAFPYTSYEVNDMPFTKEQEDMIRGIGGDDMLKRALAADTKALDDTTKLEAAGVMSKTVDNFEGSTIPEDDEIKALDVATKDIDARLKALESIKTSLTSLEASFKALDPRLAALEKSQSDALAKANDVEKRLLEYQAVEPPASKSGDTLLNEREKSLIQQISEQVKQDGSKSLIESLFGNTPAVSA